MRKLKTSDVFNMLRTIKKAGMKEELKPYFRLAAEGKLDIEDIGIETVLGLMEIMSEQRSEDAIYEFLAGPFEMDPKEVADLDLDNLINLLGQLAKENDLKVFTKAVSGLISKQ